MTRDVYGNFVAKTELIGLTTLEALACGLPVAVSIAGALPEFIQDARFGRVFTSQEELSDILQALSSHRWPPQEAGALARAHVVEKYSLEVVGQRLADFYWDI